MTERWHVGSDVFARYFDPETSTYVIKLEGRVIGVGLQGFTMRRARPRHDGVLIEHHRHNITMWPTREEAEAFIALHPAPDVPRAPHNLRGG